MAVTAVAFVAHHNAADIVVGREVTPSGPKFKLNHFQRQEALARLATGESQAAVAQTYKCGPGDRV
jgi:protein involved in polysaccharide export with SLBB domain